MKISYNWLKTLINTDLTPQELSATLTNGGLEVEAIETFESIKGGLKGLVVGHVIECDKHPDADRLSLTKVDVGGNSILSIVCGAANVAAGQKVIVATIGAKLYPAAGEPFEIKKSKIRGALSEGMICAEDETGLGAGHAGIMVLPNNVPAGTAAADYFKPETDHVLEIGLTPNRSDAASHLGVARDLVAILNSSSVNKPLDISNIGVHELPEADGLEKIELSIENTNACKRYSGLVINDITVRESPQWLKNRLNAIGLRPINNIVDITNFVLHELGQPLHAFDTDKIDGKKIIVKTANEGDKLVTLDGTERTLQTNDLVIYNANKPMCIAGIFGGLESSVTEKTTSVFLESAYFDPSFVRRSAKQHALKTDSSFRFERGVDPDITVTALVRATHLILEIAGGKVSMDVTDVYPEKLEPFKVAFSYKNCTDLIGKEIERSLIKNIILNLSIEIETEGNDGLLLKVPRRKTDVTRETDVVEEVMRIYGYNNVEAGKNICYTAGNSVKNNDTELENKLGGLLEDFGFNEIMSLSMSSNSYYEGGENPVNVVNPLSSDLNVLRTHLMYGGLEAIAYNLNRKNADLSLYEFGRSYHNVSGENSYSEKKHLVVFATGNLFGPNPYNFSRKADFACLKAVVHAILQKCGIKNYRSTESSYEKFSLGLNCIHNGNNIAEIGIISKKELKRFGIEQEVVYADFNWEALVNTFSNHTVQFEEISKFPPVRRDLALLLDKSISYNQIEELAFATEKKLLKEISLFDIYESEKLGNKKSYAVSFTLQNNEATLTDKQIDQVMEKLIGNYREKLGAELR